MLTGDGSVSPAVGFHAEMLRTRPAATAVIHTHSHFVEAQMIGGKEMPIAEAVRSKRLYLDNFIGAMWEANWRRLRRSDPDLFDVLGAC